MRTFTDMCFSRRRGAFCLMTLASAACLCSCGDDKTEQPAAPAEQPSAQQPAAEPSAFASFLQELLSPSSSEEQAAGEERAAAVAAAREALYQQLLTNISPLVTENVGVPEFNEPAKVYLESLCAYYDALAREAVTMERVDIAARVARLTVNLGAYAKGHSACETALADFNSLPEDARNTVEAKRLHSTLLNGMANCLLHINKAVDSIPYYEMALETDISVLRQLGVAEGMALPQGTPDPNLSRAAADVLGSYRCLGEAHLVSGDLEEARDLYKKGLALMEELKHLDVNSDMGVAYVKLRGALGDLESRCGNEQAALQAWAQAAQHCKAIFQATRRVDIKVKTKRFAEALVPLIQAKSEQLKAEAEAAPSAESAADAAAAAEAEQAAADAAAVQAAEEARAAEEAARAAEAEKAAAAKAAEEAAREQSQQRNRRSCNRH